MVFLFSVEDVADFIISSTRGFNENSSEDDVTEEEI
jgi:hypothetical protein